jgi:hypothetical protein
VLKEAQLASKEAAHKEASKALKKAHEEHVRLVSGLSFAALEAGVLFFTRIGQSGSLIGHACVSMQKHRFPQHPSACGGSP